MTDLPCPPQHWSRFSALLDQAMDLAEAEREAWLRALHGDDEALRPWLVRVLGSAASVSTSDFLERPLLPEELPAEFEVGDVIGPYRLLAPLGEGGMGRVWRASRDDDGPAREVALKLPHAELLAGPFRARFSRERDVLAGLSHPNIAALFDAGVGASGHPYLALELLDGKQITVFCRDGGLPLERRVELVRQVLGALAYAHGRLIVHRDIKPNNVLVTPEGAVKLLDFGIAKLLGVGDPADGQALTQPLARLASPGYAPPEQMEGGHITVAADLFSVGVLLFELCTGQRPPRLQTGGEGAPLASSRAEAARAGLPEGPGCAAACVAIWTRSWHGLCRSTRWSVTAPPTHFRRICVAGWLACRSLPAVSDRWRWRANSCAAIVRRWVWRRCWYWRWPGAPAVSPGRRAVPSARPRVPWRSRIS